MALLKQYEMKVAVDERRRQLLPFQFFDSLL